MRSTAGLLVHMIFPLRLVTDNDLVAMAPNLQITVMTILIGVDASQNFVNTLET